MWTDTLMAFGALGLILLGMDWMSRGLKTAAGPSLMQFLQRWTGKPLHGVLFGGIATVAVQSSSAVTVTTIGFVNAGILSLQNAAFVIYGSNVGTSVTGWFIALIGLQFKIDSLALPVIGAGALLQLFSKSMRRKGIGEGLIGFGMLFLGLSFLKQSFDSAFIDIQFSALSQLGLWGILLGVLLGTLLSTLMQASIAVIALVITAVSAGALPLPLAAAFVIGANLGTTSTAIMSTLAATAKAKRLAMLHVIFNVLTGLVALILLSPLLALISLLQHWLFHEPQAAVSLALFHTLFNVLGVLLMWPITSRLVLYLNGRFRRQAIGQLRTLDASSLTIPALAIKTLSMETLRIGQLLAAQALAISRGKGSDSETLDSIRQLQNELTHYMLQLSKQPLAEQEAQALSELVQNQLRLEMTLQLLPALTRQLAADVNGLLPEQQLWLQLVAAHWPQDAAAVRSCYRELMKQRQQLKKQLYQLVLADQLSNDSGGDLLLRFAELRRFNQQLTKAMLALGNLQSQYQVAEPAVDNIAAKANPNEFNQEDNNNAS
ncbi:sodium:phosphate symporter [Arsukibacterium sp. MJ3]|uniref:Na/Pi cotransporter family protein n=1 Tax=Arsukibacterium sp. MJ3 TaxID=1632859 RepID=UPI0006271CDC|nr:Na/Pi symporter [Arsukibacterium sp. MJ3]KKO48775.1 sodium:phosphate symporter [Arsukibacterium sp. MJ3]